MKILVHGVPDTPAMWQPLVNALGEDANDIIIPALPGFSSAIPAGFDCSKDAYANWLIALMERADEPVDLVGHDWGALLVVRVASLRPDLVKSWAVANALPEPTYKWHRTARIWQTPLLGELFMALAGQNRMAKALHQAGLPEALAKEEASHWNRTMRQSILALYRSAKDITETWTDKLDQLPRQGLIFWGDDDPFVPVETAERFAERTGIPLYRQANTGHWSIVERADTLAGHLRTLWST